MKKKPKSKAIHLVLSTEEALVGAINRHAELALVLKEEDAANEAAVAALKTEHTEATQSRREELAGLESSIHLYALTHRDALFPSETKHRDFANATIGFRLNPPSVATVVAKETQETVALRLDALAWGEPYVKFKPTLSKETLLRDRLILTPAQLAEAGLKFEQAEVFYIDPKAESAERVTKQVEAKSA